MAEKIKMVFVVCNGRSGSTLLQRIFDSHPNICAPIESKFVLHLATKYRDMKNWDDKSIARFCNDLYTNRKFRLFWNVDKKSLLQMFRKHSVNSFQEACKVVYLSWPSVFEKKDIHLIVDKNPLHARFLPELYEIFPSARFIHLTRDPRAVYCSQRNAFHKKQPYRLAWRWNLENSLILDFKQKNKNKFTTLSYEDLATNPKIHIKEIMGFLNLPFYEKLLSGHKILKNRISENLYLGLSHHRNIANPIDPKHIEKWKDEMSKREVGIIENITREMAAKLGYILKEERRPAFKNRKRGLAQFKTKLHHYILKSLFKLPFWIRKQIYGMVSLVFDKKYKNKS